MKRLIGPLVVAVITILFTTVLIVNKPQPEVGEAAVNRIGVYVERATRTGARAEVTVYGEVRPRVQIDVISEVSGRVTRVSPRFIEGGSIGAGDALLTIEDRDYVLAVSEARARLAARRLELEQALADADVAKKQLAGEANPSDLALKKPQIAQARAGVQAAELSLSRAESDLSRTQISLPFDARITETMVDEGQYVGIGRTVASVFSTDVAEVRLPLTDADIAALGVPIGYEADEGVGLRVQLSTDIAGATRKWSGRLVRLDASLDPRTRSTFGTVEVANPFDVADGDMPMAPGLFVAADIEGRTLADVLAIPAAGLRALSPVLPTTTTSRLLVPQVLMHSETKVLLQKPLKPMALMASIPSPSTQRFLPEPSAWAVVSTRSPSQRSPKS
jgi:RND family efflux transporter MFP subunit